ncbi:AbiTii domain-containing protein [Lysinibacillus sp. 54212]|uniref:AbiTii domain-containing protein n=1 Tax=Lysinibacillus sp. 54212 TaxID=3119829 RepID=UPI002FC954D7
MESLVLELQRDALKGKGTIAELVRKTYALARKLQLHDLAEWAKNELNGYIDEESTPEYRRVYGHLRAFNPYRGYIPVLAPELEGIENRIMPIPIAEIEELFNSNSKDIIYTLIPEYQLELMKLSGKSCEISIHVPKSEFGKIIDYIRNNILDWTLTLEEKGVVGKNMTFNEMEKERAVESLSITNNIGVMVNSQLQQSSNNSPQTISVGEFKVESLKEIIDQGKALIEGLADDNTKAELKSELTVLEAQMISPNPKKTIIKESLASIRNIAEGATGSVLVNLVPKLVEVLATL